MLLGKMEIINRVELFERFITFLEVTGLHAQLLTARRLTEFDTSVIYHVLILCFCSFPL